MNYEIKFLLIFFVSIRWRTLLKFFLCGKFCERPSWPVRAFHRSPSRCPQTRQRWPAYIFGLVAFSLSTCNVRSYYQVLTPQHWICGTEWVYKTLNNDNIINKSFIKNTFIVNYSNT